MAGQDLWKKRVCGLLMVMFIGLTCCVDQAQARGFTSCMHICKSSYLICSGYCLGDVIGTNDMLSQTNRKQIAQGGNARMGLHTRKHGRH